MNEETINLVLTDICGRLPYGVITKNCKNNFDVPAHLLPDVNVIKHIIAEYDLKPYLRPMSSMTEEEKKEIGELLDASIEIDTDGNITYFSGSDFIPCSDYHIYIDYLNAHHLDYRGLIPMGLALEAPKDMYNI